MQNRYDRCPNCMQPLSDGADTCQYCQFEVSKYEERSNCLKPFTVLQNKYMIGRVIGVGGFGITYIGWDLNLQTYIAIKEYYPASFASRDVTLTNATAVIPNESQKELYDKGLKRYVEEAQNLSKFYNLQGIVSVKDFFYENDTAYIVMEYINGINLKEYLNSCGGKMDENTVLALMKPVFESLYQIHNAGLIHRDISPDNIMVDNNKTIKLIDFGSVRGQSAATNDKTYTVILKHGYAPSEQYYASGKQGPWTDIYSLCATMYKMLTGQIPPNSIERMENDTYAPASSWGVAVSPRLEAVLRKGLAVKSADRYQNIGELLNELYGNAPIAGPTSVSPMNVVTPGVQGTTGSFTNQSMHLSMQPQVTAVAPAAPANKKKPAVIAGIVVIVILLLAGIGFIFGGGDSDDKDAKESTTESSKTTEENPSTEATGSEEPDTEEPTTEEPAGYVYEWPTELSDEWSDYQVSIDGTIYQFPMPYTEWKSQGWKADDLPTNVSSGSYDYATFYTDTVQLTGIIANYGLNEEEIDNCFIIGVQIDLEYDYMDAATVIELPGGIKLNQAITADEIKQLYGAPEYISTDEEYGTSIDYAGDEYMDGVDIQINTDGILYSFGMINTNMPEGYEVDSTDLEVTPPAINDKYVAPSGPSTDRFDSIITLDGVNYQLPVPVSQLTANGWALDSATDEYITGNSTCYTYMEKDGNKIEVTLENYTANSILPVNAYISELNVDAEYCSFEAVFPGGIKIGDQGSLIEQTYSDLGEEDYNAEEFLDYMSYDVWYYEGEDSIAIYAYADLETGVIVEYTYRNSKQIR